MTTITEQGGLHGFGLARGFRWTLGWSITTGFALGILLGVATVVLA
jgi:hypothetical protein